MCQSSTTLCNLKSDLDWGALSLTGELEAKLAHVKVKRAIHIFGVQPQVRIVLNAHACISVNAPRLGHVGRVILAGGVRLGQGGLQAATRGSKLEGRCDIQQAFVVHWTIALLGVGGRR